MAYQSLYRRYRPQRFGDVLGQDHISATLRNALRTGKVAHAYLFSGPRGCGKTTSARILAKALNCTDLQDGEPCDVCESCQTVTSGLSMDVNELDAASNNGVDAMRDLVSRAALGTAGRRKVYIVDEVHMLSTAASNALLKTLEEPPDHVVFVLATTDPQKVLPTIRSRTQHFEFRLFPFATLLELVRGVAKDAGLGLDDATLEAVTRKGNGSARDALSALDQVAAAGGVEENFDVSELTNALGVRDAVALLGSVERAVERGRDIRQLTRDLIESLREVFLTHMGMPRAGVDLQLVAAVPAAAATRALELLGEALVAMRDALDPRIVLETTLVRLVRADLDTSPAALAQRLEQIERMIASGSLPTPPSVAPVPAPSPTAAPLAASVSISLPEVVASVPVSSAPVLVVEPTPAPLPVVEPTSAPVLAVVAPPTPVLAAEAPPAPVLAVEPTSAPVLRVKASPGPEVMPVRSELPTLPSLPGGSNAAAGSPNAPRRAGIADAARAVLSTTVAKPTTMAPPSQRSEPEQAPRVQVPRPGASPTTTPPTTTSTTTTTGATTATTPSKPSKPTRAHSGHPSVDADVEVGSASVEGRTGQTVSVTDLLGDGRDQVFELLERRAKVMLSAGRFVRVNDEQVEFGLPNAMHKQRCEEWLPALVEAASGAIGRRIEVILVVDSSASPGLMPYEPEMESPTPGGRRLVSVPPLADEAEFEAEEDIDLSDLADAKDVVAPSTLEHLTSAFPGAEIVDDARR